MTAPDCCDARAVSVLFSEPKIPQWDGRRSVPDGWGRFSALQRAENSSIEEGNASSTLSLHVSVLFSEPKIPQSLMPSISAMRSAVSVLFSEPKIPQCERHTDLLRGDARVSVLFSEPKIPQLVFGDDVPTRTEKFQCSSASRKFLNPHLPQRRFRARSGFSALQRAENSSML